MAKTHFSNLTGRIRILATPPSNPAIGEMFYDRDNNSLFRYTGNNWIGFHFTSSGVVASSPESHAQGTHFSNLSSAIIEWNTPTNPQDGEWFYDSSSDQLQIYVNGAWATATMTTTTSTSTSTTTTSTSTTTTSTSSSTSSSTSTSTTTSTTTTL